MSKRVVPKLINLVVLGLVILIVVHLAVVAIMMVESSVVKESIRQANPTLDSKSLASALRVTLVAGGFFHAVFVLLYSWLAFQIRTGSRWSRMVLTVVLAVATIASATSFFSSPIFRLLIPFEDVFQLVLIGLLWLPASCRAFFAGRFSSASLSAEVGSIMVDRTQEQ
ncbi:hypothetical protein EPA93_39810 [Ktedonosporobacter rubrisoli]|uniref:DUF4386 domain-containing protein n=1 Tax=Ktedonosporobacter rubrisoli TaxID=2509675 RepID=A0A4P6K1D1_KTERU|nr:hypothetical protein [Ktedonosporobacter rubrisoli]QBD81795.1 hypothetical protein EPA93_39810 [Ktedonosporobacter rubrisoli]